MGSNSIPLGNINPWTTQGDYNAQLFAIQNAIAKMQTATLAQVVAINGGGLGPIGTLTVQPLVFQIDGANVPNTRPLAVIFNVPYLRVSGGNSGIVLDPVVGDIGIVVFCSRDISKVKSTLASAAPGSFRQYDLADAVYLGTVLSAAAPTQYLQFDSDGIAVVSPQAVKVTAPSIQMGAGGGTPHTLMTSEFYTWYLANIEPFLTGLGYAGPAPPAASVTTTVEAN